MTTEKIIEYITSRDNHKIWESACKIIELGQNHKKISPLVKFLPEIKEITVGLNMGGMFAPNQRFVDFAIKTIEFHKETKECYCGLFVEKYKLTNDVIDRELLYDGFNPNNEAKKGNVKILDTIRIENKWVDFYLVKCLKCQKQYKVEEREGHYMWWKWIRL